MILGGSPASMTSAFLFERKYGNVENSSHQAHEHSSSG